MSERPKRRLEFRDFPGLMPEVDEYDLRDGGSHDQVNVTCEDRGLLRSRTALRKVSFEDD